MADPRYQTNLEWGEPRAGHPEGTVRAHIEELERNLRRLGPRLAKSELEKLRLLIHVHDTFKAEAVAGAPIAHPRSHASLAAAFLAEFLDPAEPDGGHPEGADLLAMVRLHDEPFALWRQAKKGAVRPERFEALLAAIADWRLFSAFLVIDGSTAGKSREPLQWFFTFAAGRIPEDFAAEAWPR